MPDFMEDLRDKVFHDLMACIGCNDCILACPLTESRNVTVAELNQAALAEAITDENVKEFVFACTQCQQCVLACPADLSRADIVLWNQLKVEAASPDTPVPLQAGERILPSDWTVGSLADHLVRNPLFSGVDPVVLGGALLHVTLRRLAEGEVLVREGEYHERLTIVIDGSIEETSTEADGKQTRILALGPGAFHGHMNVMSHNREPFTVLATVESTVAELNKAAVVRLMKQSEAFNATMQNLFQDQAIWTYVKSSPLFSKLPEEDVEELTEDAELRVLRPGEVIYQEGDPGTDVFLVRSGFLRVARTFGGEQRVLQYFHKGDLCGTAAIVFDQVQSATVSANTRAEVVLIPGASVLELLKEHPEVRPALEAEARESEQLVDHHIGPPPTDRPSHQQMPMEGLLDSGVIQGHYVLAINTSVCVNCNNCVDACERRHGYSRLDRSGLQLGDLLFPTACRHCEDPVCLLCSVNGIVREPGGEVRIVPDNCIGCGACAERCPYGNINMHPREKHKRGAFRTAIEWILGEQEVTLDLHAAEGRGDRVASKCDLCAGYENYACVTACPVGAAMRMDPVEVFGPEVLIGLEAAKRS